VGTGEVFDQGEGKMVKAWAPDVFGIEHFWRFFSRWRQFWSFFSQAHD
jgi:hypothetical protein